MSCYPAIANLLLVEGAQVEHHTLHTAVVLIMQGFSRRQKLWYPNVTVHLTGKALKFLTGYGV